MVPEPQARAGLGLGVAAAAQRVETFENPLFDPFRHRRLGIVLVHDRDVVELINLLFHHPAGAVIHNGVVSPNPMKHQSNLSAGLIRGRCPIS